MRTVYRCYGSAVFIACCLLGACHVVSTDSAIDEGSSGQGGATADAGSGARGGTHAAGGMHAAGGTHAAGAADAGARSADAGAAGQAGGGDEAGNGASSRDGGADPENTHLDPATATCDVDGGCISTCANESVKCAVAPFDNYCEFELFNEIQTAVTCGQSAAVGVADCGGCGSVAVKVFYDGSNCWQGIPDCALPEFSGKFLYPHAPSP